LCKITRGGKVKTLNPFSVAIGSLVGKAGAPGAMKASASGEGDKKKCEAEGGPREAADDREFTGSDEGKTFS